MIIADGAQSFEGHVPPLQLPLVVLLKQQRADEAYDRRVVWKDADDIGSALDLGVYSLERIRRGELFAMRLREVREGEHVRFGFVHHRREFGELLTQLIGDDAPLRARGLRRLLREHRVDQRENHLPLPFAGGMPARCA